MLAAGESKPLSGKVALVAGATRGAGRAIAVGLARAGAAVYATGRSSRAAGPSEVGRPETIEETRDLIAAAGGVGIALRIDHLEPDEVRGLIERIDHDHGRLDVLVNDIFDGGRSAQFGTTIWEHDLAADLRDAPHRYRHPRHHQPLLFAVLDPPSGRPGGGDDRRDR